MESEQQASRDLEEVYGESGAVLAEARCLFSEPRKGRSRGGGEGSEAKVRNL